MKDEGDILSESLSVCLTFDFDAISLWVENFNQSSPSYISKGEFGAKVGTPRILDLLDDYGIKGTWFVPGHTAETFPEIVKDIYARSHEIGHHGYRHEDIIGSPKKKEGEILRNGLDALSNSIGVDEIAGFRAPGDSHSRNTVELLLEHGFLYDSSLNGNDFTPYYCRVGGHDSKGGPYSFGESVELVEIPFIKALDDFPLFQYVGRGAYRSGLSAPSKVLEIWKKEFKYMSTHLSEGVLTLVCHPQVIGHGHRMVMLESFVDFIKKQPDTEFSTLEEVAEAWRSEHPLGNG